MGLKRIKNYMRRAHEIYEYGAAELVIQLPLNPPGNGSIASQQVATEHAR